MQKVTWKHVSWANQKMEAHRARKHSSFGIGIQAVTT